MKCTKDSVETIKVSIESDDLVAYLRSRGVTIPKDVKPLFFVEDCGCESKILIEEVCIEWSTTLRDTSLPDVGYTT